MNEELRLWIGTKWNKIKIHKSTIRALGDPKYIRIGINVAKGQIVLKGSSEMEKGALQVDYSEYLNSKGLVEGLRKYVSPLDLEKTYSLKGQMVDGAAVFDLPKK